jgi:Ca2+-binding RTX toxin-like protein
MVDVSSNFATDARFEGNIGGGNTSGSFSSTLDFAGDEDWIQVTLQAGVAYTFTANTFDPVTGSADPSLTLLDGNGNRVGFDDDSGVGFNSFLTVTPGTAGMFFVAVTSIARSPADYVVTVSNFSTAKHELTTGDDLYTGGANEQILGGRGDDTIDLGAGVEAYGDQGNDTINGGDSGSRLFGGLGDDTINGGAFAETMYGDAGNDVLYGNLGADLIYGGIGNDSIDGGDQSDEAHGGDGNDYVFGGIGVDIIYGDGGNDTLDGGTGADIMSGDAGNDLYVVDDAGDKVSELYGSGVDTVFSTIGFSLANTARVFGSVENLTLIGALAISGIGNAFANIMTGNNAANTLSGGIGNDTLSGGLGNDRLFGEAGNDRLIGGAGVDSMTGGVGNDIFVFNTALNAATNRDVIADFNHVADTFQLENAIFTKLGAGVHALNPAFFRAGAKALDGNDYIVYNKVNGVLSYDNDGNGAHAAIAFATLTNKPVLAANDFQVI